MFRPTRPRMINNSFRNHAPYNNQWSPNYRPRTQIGNWGNARPRHFGSPITSPTNEEHWCETCDRGFPTFNLLDKHKQQHQKCNIDGCQFIAHPKVITKHIQMQHSSGLYKKISKLNNPEEIQKWREERKKKYPTKANIEKKAAECKEKIERGEKMYLKNNNRPTENHVGSKQKHIYNNRAEKWKQLRRNEKNISLKDHKTHPPPKKIPKTVPNIDERSKLKPFTGIMNIALDEIEDIPETLNDAVLIEDDDYEKTEDKVAVKEPVICGALNLLMCDYGSTDEDIDNTVNDTECKSNNNLSDFNNKAKQKLFTTDNNLNQTPKNIFDKNLPLKNSNVEAEIIKSDDEGPEEVKVVKKMDTEIKKFQPQSTKEEPIVPVRKTITNRQEHKHHYKSKYKVPSTLLHKLLFKEIRKERNIVLQCIRYIRKNNYFEENSVSEIK